MRTMPLEELSRDVVAQVAQGDRAGFRLVVERYQDPLFDLVFRLTGDGTESEDLVQEALVRVFRSIRDFDPDKSFVNWIYSITLNLTRSHLRRKSLVRFLPLVPRHEESDEDAPAFEPADSRELPTALIERKQLSAELEKVVMAMPRPLRELFVLFYFHELDVRSIATVAGISENAVKLKLMRGRAHVHADFAKKHPELFPIETESCA